jgi:hypothetical protein
LRIVSDLEIFEIRCMAAYGMAVAMISYTLSIGTVHTQANMAAEDIRSSIFDKGNRTFSHGKTGISGWKYYRGFRPSSHSDSLSTNDRYSRQLHNE